MGMAQHKCNTTNGKMPSIDFDPDLGGFLHLPKTAAGTGREKFGIERHRPIRLAVRSCVEIALNMRQRMRAGQLTTERDLARILALRAIRFLFGLEKKHDRNPSRLRFLQFRVVGHGSDEDLPARYGPPIVPIVVRAKML